MPEHAPKTPGRVLVISVNWLGDLLFMTPALRAIRRAWPEAFLSCWVPSRGLDLLQGNPHVNEVVVFPESRGLFGLVRWLGQVRRIRAGRFDAAILFHRSFTRALAVWLAGVPERIGYGTPKRQWLLSRPVAPLRRDSVHKAVGYLRLVEGAGFQPDGLRLEAGLLPEDHRSAERILQEGRVSPADRLVAMHPGANWRLKRWPAQNFARLADELAGRFGVRVVLVGDSGDLPLAKAVASRMQTEPLWAVGRTSFRELGALLSRTRLLVSNDSGPLHLGLAVGIPVLGLYGPTAPGLSGPLQEEAATSLFGSIGCQVPCRRLDCPANLCMEQITVQQALEAAGRMLREDRKSRESGESREGEDV